MKKLDAGNIFFIIVGLLVLALAGAVALSAFGQVKILGVLIAIAGMALVIFGLLSIGVFGAVLGILAIAVIIKFVEVYTIPLVVVLGLVGIGILIFGLKGTE